MTSNYHSPDVPRYIKVLCGATAEFDVDSGISYRCHDCFAVVGSVGMPRRCKELYDMEDVVNKLKSKNENCN